MPVKEHFKETEDLESALTAAVAATISIAAEKGIGPNLPNAGYEVEWMEPQDETHSKGTRALHTYPDFYLLYKDIQDVVKAHPSMQKLKTLVIEFIKHNGHPTSFSLHRDISEHQEEVLLRAYFDDLKLLKLEPLTISRTIDQFQKDWASETTILSVFFQVQSFSADTPFELSEGILFRPISMEDVYRHGRIDPFYMYMGEPRWLDLKDWICEINIPISKKEAHRSGEPIPLPNLSYNNSHHLVKYIALALNLTTKGRAAFIPLQRTFKSPYMLFAVGSGGSKKYTSRFGSKITLSQDGIRQYKRVFQNLMLEDNTKYKEIELPLRRLSASAERQDEGDHLIDCIIGLENLLAPDKGESRYKLAVRGAALLPDDFGSHRERFRLITKLYDRRSDLVHGKKDAHHNIHEWCIKAEGALQAIAQWFIMTGINHGNREEIITKLDDALIEGGCSFRDCHSTFSSRH